MSFTNTSGWARNSFSFVLCPRMDPLREALASHEDLEVIRRLCEGGKVPEGLRADLWKVTQSISLLSSFSKCCMNIVITTVALAPAVLCSQTITM